MKIYCKECGSPTDYSASKPKFCSSCGKSFLNSVAQLKTNNLKIKNNNAEEEYEDDSEEFTDLEAINNLKGLDYDIHVQKSSKQTIGDLVGTSTDSEELPRLDIPQKQLSRKEFLEQFSKEAGSLRGKNKSRKRDA